MEFLTDSLKEVFSKLSEGQKEELDVVESIINTNETKKENVKEKVFRYVKKRKLERNLAFIIRLIDRAAHIRPKEIKPLHFLLTSVLKSFQTKNKKTEIHGIMGKALKSEGVFHYGKEGTLGRALFEDNIDLLQQHFVSSPYEGKEHKLEVSNICDIPDFNKHEASRIEVSALCLVPHIY